MARYLADRLLWLVVVLLGVSVLTFGLGVVAPGDPAELILERTGDGWTLDQLEDLRREMGLDRPVTVQYLDWLGRAAQGDLGTSWATAQPVSDALLERLPRTAALAVAALLVAVATGVPLGMAAARRQGTSTDHLCRLVALLGASVPSYFLAYVLILVFAVAIPLLPVFGFGSPMHVVLPALALAAGTSAVLARLTRAAVLEVLGEDFIVALASRGLDERSIFVRHALRHALVPIVTVAGLALGGLLGGAVIVEWIFNWPGLGTLMLAAIQQKDYPVIQGFVLLAGLTYVLVNFATDVLYGWLDPRIRVKAAT